MERNRRRIAPVGRTAGSLRGAVPALVAAGFFWGTTVPLSKVALEWLPPAWLTFVRLAVAAAVLLTIGRSRVSAAFSPAVLTSGAIGYGGSVLLQNAGITRTSVSHAALLIGAVPVLVAVIAALWHRTIARPLAWAGFSVSLAGGGVVPSGGAGGATRAGDGLVLLSVLLSAGLMVAQTRLLRGRDPVAVTAVQFLGAAAGALPVAALTGNLPPVPGNLAAVLATLALAAGGTLAPFTLFAYGQSRVPAEVAGAFVNIEPVVGAFAGVIIFGDPAGFGQVAGALAILAGIAMSGLPDFRARPRLAAERRLLTRGPGHRRRRYRRRCSWMPTWYASPSHPANCSSTSSGASSRNRWTMLRAEMTSTRAKRGLSIRLASTRCPASQCRRGMKAAKLIRACSAILVRSGSTSTGPSASAMASTRSKIARTTGEDRAKCWSISPRRAQVCVWFRLAKARPQRGHTHIGLTGSDYPRRDQVPSCCCRDPRGPPLRAFGQRLHPFPGEFAGRRGPAGHGHEQGQDRSGNLGSGTRRPLRVGRAEREPGDAPLRSDDHVRSLEEIGGLHDCFGRIGMLDAERAPDVLAMDDRLAEHRVRWARRVPGRGNDRLESGQGVGRGAALLGRDVLALQFRETESRSGELHEEGRRAHLRCRRHVSQHIAHRPFVAQ